MWRTVKDGILMSELVPGDRASLVEALREKEIADWTLRIPFPYSEADADWWIAHCAEETRRRGRALNWAIRDESGALLGCAGFHDFEPGKTHRAELGYWLAKSHWGKGIGTAVVKRLVEIGFEEFELERLEAPIFDGNARSRRVLEKNGFELEGKLRHYYEKNGELRDGLLFAKIYSTRPN